MVFSSNLQKPDKLVITTEVLIQTLIPFKYNSKAPFHGLKCIQMRFLAFIFQQENTCLCQCDYRNIYFKMRTNSHVWWWGQMLLPEHYIYSRIYVSASLWKCIASCFMLNSTNIKWLTVQQGMYMQQLCIHILKQSKQSILWLK